MLTLCGVLSAGDCAELTLLFGEVTLAIRDAVPLFLLALELLESVSFAEVLVFDNDNAVFIELFFAYFPLGDSIPVRSMVAEHQNVS